MNGIIVAKEGYNTKSENENQYVNTTTPLFKLFKADKGERIYNNRDMRFGFSPDTFTIPHQLGYKPMFFLYMDRTAFTDRKLVMSGDTSPSDFTILVTCYADEKNINITATSRNPPTITGTFGYNYFIFYDRVD